MNSKESKLLNSLFPSRNSDELMGKLIMLIRNVSEESYLKGYCDGIENSIDVLPIKFKERLDKLIKNKIK